MSIILSLLMLLLYLPVAVLMLLIVCAAIFGFDFFFRWFRKCSLSMMALSLVLVFLVSGLIYGLRCHPQEGVEHSRTTLFPSAT